jgi:hypothetical protein
MLILYDKLKGDTTHYYCQKATGDGQRFSNFDRRTINDAKYTQRMKPKTTLAKENLQCKKLVTSADSTEM